MPESWRIHRSAAVPAVNCSGFCWHSRCIRLRRNGLRLFLDTLIRLRKTHHMAILLVSHDLRFVREYADHVILLEKSVLAQGTPGEVFSSPEFSAVFGTGDGEEEENA